MYIGENERNIISQPKAELRQAIIVGGVNNNIGENQ
jgi:hypothetical protein